LISGYAIFLFSAMLRSYSHDNWSSEVLLEPLLICMIGSFIVTNYSPYREDFMHILHDLGPAVYIAFFTLTGASLAVDVLIQTWAIALAIFVIRLVAIFVGSYAGGMTAGDSPKFNRIAWMTYLTQAGVGLGLAKEVAVEFPEWGGTFATIMISVIIFSQLVGPPLFKWAISRAGEAHPRGQSAEFDGVRDALIFGLTAQSVSLALQLRRHDWQVKLICVNRTKMQELATPEVDVHFVEDLSLDVLRKLDAEHADALVSFLSDEQSYQLCEMAYEHFGTETMVVRLRDRSNFERFHSLDVRVVEPRTAVSSLLEHFVLAPAGTSLLLGMDEEQEMIDIEVRDPTLHGRALRDLRLPLEVLILSIHRAGHTLVTRGHTELHLGDKVTMVGPRDKLDEVTLRFDS
jgi:Trk K+ transport system NAD-binding subunit